LRNPIRLITTVALVSPAFIIWDAYAISQGHWFFDPEQILALAKERSISEETLATLRYSGIDVDGFLRGFDNVEESVRNTVDIIRRHPMLPADVPVHGLIIYPETGRLDLIVNGYSTT
jgi:carbonic anhydrase